MVSRSAMWALVPLGEIFAKPLDFNIVDIAELKGCNISMLVKKIGRAHV